MISLEIPVEKIPFIRTIEGRKFKNGKWEFPDSAAETLSKYGLINNTYNIEEKQEIQFEISPHLYGYQKKVVNKALNMGGYGLFLETGTGKTICGLEIAAHYNKTLIVCPLSIINSAWIEDCNKFYSNKTIINCWNSNDKERRKLLHSKADIYVMNYDHFKILKNDIRMCDFDCLIVDESSVMKNMTAQITSDLLSMIDVIPHRYVLSGTPTPNHNSEIFPQIKLVNPEIFGNNYYGFQARYFHQDLANPHVWYQTQEDKDRFFNRLDDISVFLNKEDCIELPEKVFQIKKFGLDTDQKKHYENMVKDIKDNINNWSKFEFTAKLMKLREIVSGFVINKDGSITDFPTKKEDVLKECFDEIGDKPIIIWCQFKHEVERLAAKFDGVALTSETKGRDDIIKDFQSGKIKRLFTLPKILGMGLTFTNCTYNIYYSLSFSFEEFKQSQDRIHRIGQKNKCTYIVLQGENTIDEKIYSCLQRKKSAVDELFLEMGFKND